MWAYQKGVYRKNAYVGKFIIITLIRYIEPGNTYILLSNVLKNVVSPIAARSTMGSVKLKQLI